MSNWITATIERLQNEARQVMATTMALLKEKQLPKLSDLIVFPHHYAKDQLGDELVGMMFSTGKGIEGRLLHNWNIYSENQAELEDSERASVTVSAVTTSQFLGVVFYHDPEHPSISDAERATISADNQVDAPSKIERSIQSARKGSGLTISDDSLELSVVSAFFSALAQHGYLCLESIASDFEPGEHQHGDSNGSVHLTFVHLAADAYYPEVSVNFYPMRLVEKLNHEVAQDVTAALFKKN